ncbi:hypothetical protein [Sphaerisporangium dianthi]|uniref:Uncharacterized protein n=1 Tax=Sphaerisporangium dianthi TaxID=1436120 RepID=A0ABV9CHK7_9ACTN
MNWSLPYPVQALAAGPSGEIVAGTGNEIVVLEPFAPYPDGATSR